MIPIIVAAVLIGWGSTLVIAALTPTAPDMSDALERLDQSHDGGRPSPPVGLLPLGAAAAVARWARLDRYRADMAITGTPSTRIATEKLGYAALGLLFPLLLTTAVAALGLAVPVAIPAVVALALGVVLSFVPEQDLLRRARAARDEVRRAVCAYLELVALERAADAGAVEAMERASMIGSGRGFRLIQESLLRARLEGRAPWHHLSLLAEQVEVPELGDVADIMRMSGEDGAAVLPTLRARAASLRTALLQADVAQANRASERMSIPVALLGVAFMALLGFPAFSRILFG